jgi:hypothetical protein
MRSFELDLSYGNPALQGGCGGKVLNGKRTEVEEVQVRTVIVGGQKKRHWFSMSPFKLDNANIFTQSHATLYVQSLLL